jgi:hypothetical protein
MSKDETTALLEFAYEVAEHYTSHPSGVDVQLLAAISVNDLNEVRWILNKVEGSLAQNHFHAHDLLEQNDVY